MLSGGKRFSATEGSAWHVGGRPMMTLFLRSITFFLARSAASTTFLTFKLCVKSVTWAKETATPQLCDVAANPFNWPLEFAALLPFTFTLSLQRQTRQISAVIGECDRALG